MLPYLQPILLFPYPVSSSRQATPTSDLSAPTPDVDPKRVLPIYEESR